MTKLYVLFAALWLSVFPTAGVAETYRNDTIGLEVTKPTDWKVLTVEANAENLRKVPLSDPELQALVAKYSSAPIYAFAKHDEPFDDLNPSFKINLRAAGSFAGRSALEIINVILPGLQRAFADLVIEQAPQATQVSNLPGAYLRVAYTLKTAGQNFPTVSEMWIVPRGSYFFIIGIGTRADEKTGTRAEARSIVDTLKIAALP